MPRKTPHEPSGYDGSGRVLSFQCTYALDADIAEFVDWLSARELKRYDVGECARRLLVLGLNAWRDPARYPQAPPDAKMPSKSPARAAQKGTGTRTGNESPYAPSNHTISIRTSFVLEQMLEEFRAAEAAKQFKAPDRSSAALRLLSMGVRAWRYQQLQEEQQRQGPKNRRS